MLYKIFSEFFIGFASENVVSLFVNRLSLFVDDAIVIEEVFSDAEIPAFHLLLRSDDGTGELLLTELEVFKIIFSKQHSRHSLDSFASHLTHDQVIKRDEEDGYSRIALPTCTSSQLIIDSP